MQANSANEGIAISPASGEIVAETINGDITLARPDATLVDASTVNATLTYDGTIRHDGHYRLTTHNGD